MINIIIAFFILLKETHYLNKLLRLIIIFPYVKLARGTTLVARQDTLDRVTTCVVHDSRGRRMRQ
jgi:hypothetical protein